MRPRDEVMLSWTISTRQSADRDALDDLRREIDRLEEGLDVLLGPYEPEPSSVGPLSRRGS